MSDLGMGTCEYCTRTFKKARQVQRFCRRACRSAWKRLNKQVTCPTCGTCFKPARIDAKVG